MAEKLTIRQTIVVEGRADVVRVREAVNCDIITTQGFRLSGETLLSIQKAQERVGVIVLTDPDGVGARIRRRIEERVPGVWHCYLLKEDAREKGDIGIENASVASIQEALLRCIELHTPGSSASSLSRDSDRRGAPVSEAAPRLTDASHSISEIDFVPWTTADLYRLGLAGDEGARALRAKVGKALGIGYAATNRFLFRLNQYRISREAVAREFQERE